MSAASPTPLGAGSHFTSMGRRTSARQALRRPTSRQQLSRSESNPVGNAAPPMMPAAGKDAKSHSQPQQYSTLNDSSDDEMPVPMKLSALTKALLNDGHASEASSSAAPAAGDRPSSPPARPSSRVMTRRNALATSTSSQPDDKESRRESLRQRETRRHARAGSTQLPSSRPSSPVRSRDPSPAPPRKRVVRLSTTTPANGGLQGSIQGGFQNGLRRSLSSSTQPKRAEIKEVPVPEEKKVVPPPVQPEQPPPKDVPADVNTPVVPVRTVRIAVGSSGNRGRSGGSSGVSAKRSAGHSDHEMPEDPATIGRPTVVAPQSSMRVKRIGNAPGSFLSGPARRGRRRQSEEDAEGQGEGEVMGSSQEPESQQQQFMEPALGEQPASSFVASSYRDFAASGSPVSARDSGRAAIRKQASSADIQASHAKESNDHMGLDFKIPAPPQLPSGRDKENEMPSAFRRSKPATDVVLDKELVKPIQPLHVDIGQPRHASPERKALAMKSQNTPHRPAPPPPPKMSVVETATAAAGASATGQASKKRQVLLRVNTKTYTRIDCIGRGGSGKVYRVSAENGKMLALKRVSLENADENTVKGFKGEIDLLKRLAGIDRVIQLIDHELNIEKQMLSVLMEVGELDFNTLLKSRQSTPEGARLDPVFIRYYWKEMLECVQAVHARDVVHSDLKPANFVLVQGRLKLIDFGIANAIQTEMTVNVHRETQIGTPNYMSPESLMDSNQYAFTSANNGKFCLPPPLQHQHRGQPKIMKLGKPSDVWSLGCILYQMVYGLPPFGKIANQMSRCQAIINWAYQVDFPDTTEDGSRVPPSLIRTMRRCLNREQKERPTCDELLADTDPFLYPQEFDPAVYAAAEHGKVLPVTEELLSRIIQSVVQRCRERLPTEGEAVSTWPGAYWASVKKAVSGNNVAPDRR
ncbi:kinase-like domain-containing protein [Cercophora newfieldiana]|uniref:Kinase-like domain-containing protein n=1 Tax=Cercophora newfieldiana TaxID=92897 RepID=A0AA39YQP1_9PEZI|nr:kinase-like domain-containing protein [Cercophora newfieldiana]